MSATHEQLLKVVVAKIEDYEPWGVVDRENVDGKGSFGPDCSCGCKFYVELEGKLGMDWGVCRNPKSHRAGLLTFEHQGCRHFKYDKSLDDAD
jgi:hypothetical protein